jgi:hypothetical protein
MSNPRIPKHLLYVKYMAAYPAKIGPRSSPIASPALNLNMLANSIPYKAEE